MNYKAAFNDFFLSPKWTNNLLFGALLMLIPGVNIAGAMIIIGWLIEGFWCRTDESPVTFPEFNFNRLERYITLGLWPMLVIFIVGIAAVIVLIPVSIIATILHLSWLVSWLFWILLFILARPLALRASLTQDFAKALDFKFIAHFYKVMLPELAISSAVLAAPIIIALLVMHISFALSFLLFIAVSPVVMYATSYLDKELYKIYLSRGGEAIPLSPKLTPVLSPVVPVEIAPQ